jgi:hypothetical protein
MTQPENEAASRFALFAAVIIGLIAVCGLINGVLYGKADWCSGGRNTRHCRTVWADQDYAYVQHMIYFYWILLAASVIYISYRRLKTSSRGNSR